MFVCREYNAQKSARQAARESFRAEQRRQNRNDSTTPQRFVFPPNLQGPIPPMSTWIRNHIQSLRLAEFPIPMEVLALSQPPDSVAMSYASMWAYGAHSRTDRFSCPTYVTYDSGIAHITEEGLEESIDVGVLKSILHVNFGTMSAVLMKGEWYEKKDQGRTVIKKDRYGFWTVKPSAKEDPDLVNPFAYPEHISQVFFMTDLRDPDCLVVIKNDVRTVRVVGERELPYFGASGSEEGTLVTPTLPNLNGHTEAQGMGPNYDVVREGTVQALDATIRVQVQNGVEDDNLSKDDSEEDQERLPSFP